CVSCGCPLTLQRGNDGQPPWFEHDQMTVAEKILLRCFFRRNKMAFAVIRHITVQNSHISS
ncbi:DUF7828 domain-containing protein, partial [Escherichia coli]|uniref:DUF7828 domain-containing protein n=1 Tax=Escherichia coli TaxID=562 RepID=UPI003F51A9ED